MVESELSEIERNLGQGNCRPEDMRRLIHAVKFLQNQLDTIQRLMSSLPGSK